MVMIRSGVAQMLPITISVELPVGGEPCTVWTNSARPEPKLQAKLGPQARSSPGDEQNALKSCVARPNTATLGRPGSKVDLQSPPDDVEHHDHADRMMGRWSHECFVRAAVGRLARQETDAIATEARISTPPITE
jgi:hypothetical protein